MTYPTGAGTFTNNFGPAAPASNYSYEPPAGTGVPAAAANVAATIPSPATFNYANTIISTREFLDNTLNVESTQQGTAAISNTAAVILAGQTAGGTQFYKWQ